MQVLQQENEAKIDDMVELFITSVDWVYLRITEYWLINVARR